MEDQNSSSSSDIQRAFKVYPKEMLNDEKIQKFNQALERLKIFVNENKSLNLAENDNLFKYLEKFRKHDNSRKNVDASDSEVILIAKQRLERMIKSQKVKRNWSNEDLKILDWLVIHYALQKKYTNIEKQFTSEDWKIIASMIPSTTPDGCMFKWLSLHKTNLFEASWNEQQSEVLKALVAKYVSVNKSIRWKDVCKKLYLQNKSGVYRTPKQCKEHWNFKLNPNLRRQPWTQEEDILLFKTIKQNSGLKKWVEMVKLFDGRTQNAVKNRYNLIIDKQKRYLTQEKDELQLVEGYLQRCYVQKNTKIIEPDSEQQIQTSQNQKKRLRKQKNKRQKTKKKNQIDKDLQIIEIKGNKKDSKQTLNMDVCSMVVIDKKNQKQSTQNPNRNLQQNRVHPGSFVSIQNLSLVSIRNFEQISEFNHRANDIEFNFMDFDDSMPL